MAGDRGLLVFESGKEYEIISIPYKEGNSECVELFAVSENGKRFRILQVKPDFGETLFAIDSFDFSKIEEAEKSGNSAKIKNAIFEKIEACKKDPDCFMFPAVGEKLTKVLLTDSEIKYILKRL
ncbi:MAG TPA: hypothetical protein P5232_03145 [Candidatus Moranbacteria bacterium]|nr:hypothetical protein [Candidatus Moranbacteria bacterium]